MRPDERLVQVADTRLFLRKWGERGAPVLFWHALGDHTSMQMVEVGPILAGDFGYRVIGVDAPGFGGSPRLPDERYEMPQLVALARALLDALDFERAVWSGSSWGAGVGVHVAAEHPERLAGLILLDGGYLDFGEGKTLEELREHWRGQPGFGYSTWQELIEEGREYFGRWSPGLEESVRSAFREEDGEVVSIMGPDVYAAALYGVDRSPPTRVHGLLGETGVPVLLLAATEPPPDEKERAAGLTRFAERVPQADVRPLEGAGHFLLEERPGEAARAIGDWLRGLGYE